MRRHIRIIPTGVAVTMAFALASVDAGAQVMCPVTELSASLQRPIGVVQSNQGNLFVAESGTAVPNTGRISMVDPAGHQSSFLEGLPSGISDVGDPSGLSGLYLRGRTIYLVIGSGDTVFPGAIPNPHPSSPIFSSVLAIHFSAGVEKKTLQGFGLTWADTQAIADGQKMTISNIDGGTISVELAGQFPGLPA